MPVRPLHLSLLLLSLLCACGPGHGLPSVPPTDAAYRLGPAIRCACSRMGEDALSGDFRVSAAGTIAVPLLGGVRAAGLTPAELGPIGRRPADAGQAAGRPSVAAEVTAYRPIFVLGEVNKPGGDPYQPGMTVVTAAAVAGGFTYRAVQGYVSVVRTVNGHAVEGKATRQTFLQPGDVVTVYERWF